MCDDYWYYIFIFNIFIHCIEPLVVSLINSFLILKIFIHHISTFIKSKVYKQSLRLTLWKYQTTRVGYETIYPLYVLQYVSFILDYWWIIHSRFQFQETIDYRDVLLILYSTHSSGDNMAATLAEDTSKYKFVNENIWISIKISMKFVPKGQWTIFRHWFK